MWFKKKPIKKCQHVKIFLPVYFDYRLQTVSSITVVSLALLWTIPITLKTLTAELSPTDHRHSQRECRDAAAPAGWGTISGGSGVTFFGGGSSGVAIIAAGGTDLFATVNHP